MSKRYRSGIVGCGFIGMAHREALARLGNVDVVALCDTVGAKEKAEESGIENSYTDYRKMIDEQNLDSIHICTPNFTHYEIAKYAIEHGVNVVCEKPFTTTIEQAEELVRLAKEKNVKGYLNFHNRFYAMTNEMHCRIKAGELGKVFSVHGEYIQDWLLYETDYSWRLEKSQVGSTRAIADIGSHWLDLAEFTTGLKVKKVNALFSTVYETRKKPIGKVETFSSATEDAKYSTLEIDTEDIAMVLFAFDNGAIGSLVVSQVFAGKKNTCNLKIAGSEASLVWDSEALNDLYIGYRDVPNQILPKDASLLHKGAARNASYPGGHVEGFPDAFKHGFGQFYASLNNEGEYDYATFEDGLREMVLCEAIFESSQKGDWVEV